MIRKASYRFHHTIHVITEGPRHPTGLRLSTSYLLVIQTCRITCQGLWGINAHSPRYHWRVACDWYSSHSFQAACTLVNKAFICINVLIPKAKGVKCWQTEPRYNTYNPLHVYTNMHVHSLQFLYERRTTKHFPRGSLSTMFISLWALKSSDFIFRSESPHSSSTWALARPFLMFLCRFVFKRRIAEKQ